MFHRYVQCARIADELLLASMEESNFQLIKNHYQRTYRAFTDVECPTSVSRGFLKTELYLRLVGGSWMSVYGELTLPVGALNCT